MKDSMRKKPAVASSGSEFDVTSQLDVTSQSSDSVSPNPWASEATSTTNGESISRQVSKTSKATDTTSPIRSIISATAREDNEPSPPPGQRLDIPGTNGDALNEDGKPTRRRKTVTKTPHTFELEADLNPTTPKKEPAAAEPPKQEVQSPTPTPKKKKRVSVAQTPLPDPPITHMPVVNSVPSVQQTVNTLASPIVPSAFASPATPTTPSLAISPASPKQPTLSASGATNPFTAQRAKKTQSLSSIPQVFTSNPCRFTPPTLPKESFHGKVVVLTHGASQVGQALIRHFHAAGCKVLFGDTNPDQARRFISSLGPPHVVHFNKCDLTSYSSMLELFKLAVTMYGRVDHAIFGVGEDGGQVTTVGGGEKGWFEDRPGMNKTAKMAYDEVATEPSDLGDLLTASIRFARIAMAYLKYSPKAKASKKIVNPYSTPQAETSTTGTNDRSLTFLTSIAAFKETPQLPIYQITQHAIVGLVRSLRTGTDPDPERDGVRINAVVTNVMVPRAVSQVGGRSMSVQLPPDKPEDVARVVVGVVATNSSIPDINGADSSSGSGITSGGGIWYEKGHERGMREKYLHGRVIYAVGTECWDIQEGLDRSETVWIGQKPAEFLSRNMAGLNLNSTGGQSSWILDMV